MSSSNPKEDNNEKPVAAAAQPQTDSSAATNDKGEAATQPPTAYPPYPTQPQGPPQPYTTQGAPQPYPPQPYVVGVPPQQVNPPAWSTGLFECFDDIPTLVITFFAPCVTFGQVAEMVDRGRTSCVPYTLVYSLIMYFTGCGCLLSAYNRMKMSHQFRLPDDPIINILVHLVCEPCALCQEYRELQARGFDMNLGVGWRNQTPEIQQRYGEMMVPPTVPGGMTR